MSAIAINFNSIADLTDDQFYQLCRDNPDVKFERNVQGDLLIVAPTGGETGNRHAGLTAQLWLWSQQAQIGPVFDSSTCFKLPNSATRSPDAAWIAQARWDTLTSEQKEKFPPISPDFVVELMSPSDSLPEAQAKMQEYLDNGVQLAWLINRPHRQVEIYCLGQSLEVLTAPEMLSGENLLPGFVLDLKTIW